MAETATIRHITDPTHLLDWLQARGQKNLVFSVADMRKMTTDWRLILLEIWHATMPLHPDTRPQRERLADAPDSISDILLPRIGTDGYLVLPINGLRLLPMPELVRLQELVFAYRDQRRGEWKPIAKTACVCGGKLAGCATCGGRGAVETLVELSEHERLLAEQS